jgi:hypothetical protein
VRKNPPYHPPRFLPITENGTVEEYMGDLNVRVQDIWGNIITDGSVNVTVYLDGKLLAWKGSDASGLAVFSFITKRYTAKETWSFSGSVNATRDGGGYSNAVHTNGYGNITVTINSKWFPPFRGIISPDNRTSPIIDASQFIRPDGRTELFLIEGIAWDNPRNPMPTIERVEVRIGDGDWNVANLTVVLSNHYEWNLTWDVYRWAEEQLKRYPAGIIPCPIYARAWNGFSWSDDLEQGGSTVCVNMIVTLLKIPPRPPDIAIIMAPNVTAIPYETPITFTGVVVRSYGTKIIRWEWCFDPESGYHPDFSSPDCSTVTTSFPRERRGEFFEIILKAYDNESARRVELYQAGVPYDEFGYDFDPNDGSISVKLRVYITDPPDRDKRHPPDFWPLVFLLVLVVVLYLSFMLAAQRQRLARDRLSRRK